MRKTIVLWLATAASIVVLGAAHGGESPATEVALSDSDSIKLGPAETMEVRVRPISPSPLDLDTPQRVEYKSFDGRTLELNAFSGKYVRMLLPDSLVGAGGVPNDVRRTLLDHLDLNYEHYKEILGAEPPGTDLLNVAWVHPPSCGACCGLVGGRGIETDAPTPDSTVAWFTASASLEGNSLGCLYHEMAHNFDRYEGYLAYYGDWSHAWTWFFDIYAGRIFSREGEASRTPASFLRTMSFDYVQDYLTNPLADWPTCVETGGGCESIGAFANLTWAGFNDRLALLTGAETIPKFLQYMKTYADAHSPPTTAQAKEDLHVQALASATGLNLGCYADFWKWPLSDSQRAAMTAQYGSTDPLCQDQDGDGWTPVAGDLDDKDPAVHPGAIEVANGKDDDCDGVVDDVAYIEPAGGDFTENLRVNFPAKIHGQITINTPDGSRSTARLFLPASLAVDSQDNIFEIDGGGNRVRKIAPDGTVTTIAGSGTVKTQDGAGSAASFDFSFLGGFAGITLGPDGNLYVAETQSHTIRRVTPDGQVTTLAGKPDFGGYVDGSGADARFTFPTGIAAGPDGALYIADRGNQVIRRMTLDGKVSTYAGSPGHAGHADGPAAAAQFLNPIGIATDSTGTVFVADTDNFTIRKISPGGVVSTIAGSPGVNGSADGTGTQAAFSYPWSIVADTSGNIYVADTVNRTIRRIDPAGNVSTIAGLAGTGDNIDGTGSAARFALPTWLVRDNSGSLIVADRDAETLRKVSTAGAVSTIAGTRFDAGPTDADHFIFHLAAPTNVHFTIASDPDFQGWLFLYNQTGGGWAQTYFISRGNKNEVTWKLGSGDWLFGMELNTVSLPGSYTVTLAPADVWPDPWGTVTAAGTRGAAPFHFTAKATNLSHALTPVTAVRFWVSTLGFVGTVPYSPETTYDWNPPAGLPPGTYGVRAQLVSNGIPATEATFPVWFDVSGTSSHVHGAKPPSPAPIHGRR